MNGRINVFEGYRESIHDDHKVMRAYQAALQSFNAGHWDGTVSMCGKVLENIAKSELPFTEHNGTLGKLIEKLSKQIYNERPLDKFAASLKDRHGLGGHFELDKEATQETAMLTLDLIECMMSYLYVMRARIDQLLELVGSEAIPVENDSDYDDYLQEAQRQEERERLANQALMNAQPKAATSTPAPGAPSPGAAAAPSSAAPTQSPAPAAPSQASEAPTSSSPSSAPGPANSPTPAPSPGSTPATSAADDLEDPEEK